VPNVTLTVPNVTLTVPNVTLTVPNVTETVPNVTLTMPNVTLTVPNVKVLKSSNLDNFEGTYKYLNSSRFWPTVVKRATNNQA
jgi:hypothetical protein